MNIQEILLGGIPQEEKPQMMGQTPSQTQTPSGPNPFAGFLNMQKMMQEDPKGMEERIMEISRKGMRAPEFTPETFLQYVQKQQSAKNGAVQGAGTGIPAQGAAPQMPMPQARGY